MKRMLSLGRLAGGTGLGLALLLLPFAGRAAGQAGGNVERVRFETADQVEIHGSYYPSSKGTKGGCAILLHQLGGNSQQEGWDDLARELQQKLGLAVLTFDFRGHGNSVSVRPGFWTFRGNQLLKTFRPNKLPSRISYKDFSRLESYLLMVNDIAAAKRFLDRKNDNQECNTSNVVLIGAETGATLGVLWARSEWERRRIIPGTPVLAGGQPIIEGQDLACAVCLSISPTIHTYKVNVSDWLRPIRKKLPVFLLHGENDSRAANFSRSLYENALQASSDKSLKYTSLKAVPGSNKLAGRELLGKKSLGTEELIVKYVEKVLDEGPKPLWSKRDVDKLPLVPVPIELFVSLR